MSQIPRSLTFAEPPPALNVTAPQPYRALNLPPGWNQQGIPPSTPPVPDRPPIRLPSSTGSPPPTLQTSGLTSPTGVTTGSAPTPIANAPTPAAVPPGIRAPLPIGRIAGGAAIGGVIDLASRLASGQPVATAVAGASATTAGSIAGGTAGFIVAGPAGAMVGGMIGGSVAGAAFDLLNPPSSTEAQPPYQPRSGVDGQTFPTGVEIQFFNPSSQRNSNIVVSSFYIQPKGTGFTTASGQTQVLLQDTIFVVNHPSGLRSNTAIDPNTLTFPNGAPDSAPESPKADRRAMPRGAPVSPSVSSPVPGISFAPSPGASVRPGGPRTIPSGTTPTAPSPDSNLGGALPELQRSPSPALAPALGFAPDKPKLDLVPNLLQTPIPGTNNRGTTTQPVGRLAGPSPDAVTATATPTAQGQTAKSTPIPDSQKPTPKPAQTPEEKADQDLADRLGSIENQLTMLGLAIASLIANPLNAPGLTPEQAKQAAASGTCETLQPQGCMRKEFDEVGNQNKANSDKLDAINAGLNAADLAGMADLSKKIDQIDNKLGLQLPDGGISGLLKKTADLLGKTWDFLQIDRILNVLTFATALHNAYMLSSNIGQTLFSAIGNILDVFGIEDKEGGALDVSAMVAEWTDSFAKKLFGVTTVEGIKAEWKKINRIYQAAANIMWSVQSIFDSMRSLQEMAIENTGKIGNALRKAGAVFENAYGPLVERATARNATQKRWDDIRQGLESVENAISTVDSAASEVLSIQETLTELQKQRKEVEDSVSAYKSEESKKEAETKAVSVAPQL